MIWLGNEKIDKEYIRRLRGKQKCENEEAIAEKLRLKHQRFKKPFNRLTISTLLILEAEGISF